MPESNIKEHQPPQIPQIWEQVITQAFGRTQEMLIEGGEGEHELARRIEEAKDIVGGVFVRSTA